MVNIKHVQNLSSTLNFRICVLKMLVQIKKLWLYKYRNFTSVTQSHNKDARKS